MRNKKSYKLDKIFRKILKCFNMFEHPDIWSNLEEKCQVKFRDSIRKNYMVQETRKSTLWYFHFCYNISTCLSTQISCRILKKTIWSFSGTQIRNKSCCFFQQFCITLIRVIFLHFWDNVGNNKIHAARRIFVLSTHTYTKDNFLS